LGGQPRNHQGNRAPILPASPRPSRPPFLPCCRAAAWER
jgi:hypothetical protein